MLKNSIDVAKNSISDCLWHVSRQVEDMINKINLCKDARLCKVTKTCKVHSDPDCNFEL